MYIYIHPCTVQTNTVYMYMTMNHNSLGYTGLDVKMEVTQCTTYNVHVHKLSILVKCTYACTVYIVQYPYRQIHVYMYYVRVLRAIARCHASIDQRVYTVNAFTNLIHEHVGYESLFRVGLSILEVCAGMVHTLYMYTYIHYVYMYMYMYVCTCKHKNCVLISYS